MKKKLIFLLVIITAGYFAGCNKNDDNKDNPTTPFKVRLTDAPTTVYDSVIIDLQAVEVIQATSTKSVVALDVNKGLYNLLDFTNGKDTLIASATLPSTMVLQIRLILGPNNYVVVGGVRYPLETPSAEQSGLKINVHATLLAGVEYIMTLDFDAARSIVVTGSGKYILKPVIRVIPGAQSGSIKGSVAPWLALPTTAIAANSLDTFSAVTDTAGLFLISGVRAGTYTVYLYPQIPFLNDTINNVLVNPGAITDLGVISF